MAGAKHSSSFLPSPADDRFFPPAMTAQLLDASVKIAPATLAAQSALPAAPSFHVELEDAKSLIVKALRDFDPQLGDKAQAFFDHSKERLNLRVVDEGKGVMMRVRPAGMTKNDAMSFVGHKDYDALKKEFPIDHNPKKHSIIDFQYDGRIHALIYLAHELGHALADDDQLTSKRSYRDNPKHMEETQAYLVQSIVTLALADKNNPDKQLAAAAQRHFADELAGQVYTYPLAQVAQEAMTAMGKGQSVNPAVLFEKKFGAGWEKVAQEDWAGKKVFEAMATGGPDAAKTLQAAVDRINDRPVQQLVAAGIIMALQNRDPETKSLVIETAFGLHGRKTISDVFDVAGIKGDDAMQKFMQSTVEKVRGFSMPDASAGAAPAAENKSAPMPKTPL